MKSIFKLILLSALAFSACKNTQQNLLTQSVAKGENKCIVQRLPEDYAGSEENKFEYYRVIIDSKAKLLDSSQVSYVNFGMESSIKKIASKDTLNAAFVQRIANGKKDNYEYIVSFEKTDDKNFEILISDEVFEMGLISIKF